MIVMRRARVSMELNNFGDVAPADWTAQVMPVPIPLIGTGVAVDNRAVASRVEEPTALTARSHLFLSALIDVQGCQTETYGKASSAYRAERQTGQPRKRAGSRWENEAEPARAWRRSDTNASGGRTETKSRGQGWRSRKGYVCDGRRAPLTLLSPTDCRYFVGR